jgi:predicted ATP-dependent protease
MYRVIMSALFRQLVRYAAQKVASDPEMKEKVINAAQEAVREARQVAGEDERAYAAGKACRRAFDRLLNNR